MVCEGALLRAWSSMVRMFLSIFLGIFTEGSNLLALMQVGTNPTDWIRWNPRHSALGVVLM